ncbi:MAG: hypothetical protein DSY55_03405, partial [Clostridia bacterium]
GRPGGGPRRQLEAWLTAAGHLAVAWGAGGLIASPWLLRNWRLYGDPLGWALVRQTIDQRQGPVDASVLWWLFRGLYTYFWGRFGAIGQIRLPAWAFGVAGLVTLALLAGVLLFLRRHPRRNAGDLFALTLLAAAPLLALAGIIRYTAIALGTDQARLLWPGIAAIAVWAGSGILGLSEASGYAQTLRKDRLIVGVLAASSLFGLLTLLLLVRPAFT